MEQRVSVVSVVAAHSVLVLVLVQHLIRIDSKKDISQGLQSNVPRMGHCHGH